MCLSMKEINVLKSKLEKVELDYKEKSRKLIALRKNIEYHQSKKETESTEQLRTSMSKSGSDVNE